MMANCWKCGTDTPFGVVECGKCQTVTFTHTDASHREWRNIDMSKVNTLDDMKKVFAAMGLRVLIGGAQWEALREFLEE